MAKISFSKEQIESSKSAGYVVPDGLAELRLEGFEPRFAKDHNSVNLRPILKVVNHPDKNDTQIYDNMNSSADWIITAFVHAMGHPMIPNANGGADMPGEFMGPDDDPTKWQYVGPLTGCVAKVILKKTTYNGKDSSKVDQWLCALGSNCNEKHPNGLAK